MELINTARQCKNCLVFFYLLTMVEFSLEYLVFLNFFKELFQNTIYSFVIVGRSGKICYNIMHVFMKKMILMFVMWMK